MNSESQLVFAEKDVQTKAKLHVETTQKCQIRLETFGYESDRRILDRQSTDD